MRTFAIATLLLIVPALSAAQDTVYNNPVDGKTYVAPQGWKTYKPEAGAPDSNGEVRVLNVRLLQEQEELASRSTPEDLANYIKSASKVATEVFSSYNKRAVLLTQFTCKPGKCEVKITSSGAPPDDLLQSYYDKLVKLPPPETSGEIRFQVTTGVNS